MIRPVVGNSYYIGIEENGPSTGSGTFMVYPNPVSNLLHIESDIKGGQVSIYDLMGKKVFGGKYQTVIPVDQFTDGMYLLSITTDEGLVINQKFIIRK